MLEVSDKIKIPLSEITFSYALSSGPGGQHVNKTSSKAILKWNFQSSSAINSHTKLRILELYPSLIASAEILTIKSDKSRQQRLNTQDCLNKLKDIVLKASHIPKKRRPTKPSKNAKQKRLNEKKKHGDKKKLRKPVDY